GQMLSGPASALSASMAARASTLAPLGFSWVTVATAVLRFDLGGESAPIDSDFPAPRQLFRGATAWYAESSATPKDKADGRAQGTVHDHQQSARRHRRGARRDRAGTRSGLPRDDGGIRAAPA